MEVPSTYLLSQIAEAPPTPPLPPLPTAYYYYRTENPDRALELIYSCCLQTNHVFRIYFEYRALKVCSTFR